MAVWNIEEPCFLCRVFVFDDTLGQIKVISILTFHPFIRLFASQIMFTPFYELPFSLRSCKHFCEKKHKYFISRGTVRLACLLLFLFSDRPQWYCILKLSPHAFSRLLQSSLFAIARFRLRSHSFLTSGMSPPSSNTYPLTESCSEQSFSAVNWLCSRPQLLTNLSWHLMLSIALR